jgi:hypothetical protein
MTGVWEVFTELDTNVYNTVKFGVGSMVEIEGIGTIMFVCKNGEHKTLSSVYLIPKLTTNIISLGQMDVLGYEMVIRDGVMWVCDEEEVDGQGTKVIEWTVCSVYAGIIACQLSGKRSRQCLAVACKVRALEFHSTETLDSGGAGKRSA